MKHLFKANNKEQKQLKAAMHNPEKRIIIVHGDAGTGKTSSVLDWGFGLVMS